LIRSFSLASNTIPRVVFMVFFREKFVPEYPSRCNVISASFTSPLLTQVWRVCGKQERQCSNTNSFLLDCQSLHTNRTKHFKLQDGSSELGRFEFHHTELQSRTMSIGNLSLLTPQVYEVVHSKTIRRILL